MPRSAIGGAPAGLALCQHLLDRRDDADIAGAAAEVARKLEADARLVGVRQPRDDVAAGDQHAGRAIAALQGVMRRERRAQVGHHRIVAQALDGGDLRALAGHREGDARARGCAVDQHRARAADAVLAADVSTGEILLAAQEIREMRARLSLRRDGLAVDAAG